ncbi:MAG TPA: hypothetical protein VN843_00480, partial [Anaerolineales bacterium]|nr:hypothetical protein [Anaerolineales bacterium]
PCRPYPAQPPIFSSILVECIDEARISQRAIEMRRMNVLARDSSPLSGLRLGLVLFDGAELAPLSRMRVARWIED